MGAYSAKDICAVCGSEIPALKRILRISNNQWVCSKCFNDAGLTLLSPYKTMTPDTIKNLIATRNNDINEFASFHTTRQVGTFLNIDENSRKWFIPEKFSFNLKYSRIHSYDDILDFELLQDGDTIIKGGLGRALVGGALFGGVGAVVGGVTGKRTTKKTCKSLRIKITLNDIATPVEYIDILKMEVKINSIAYRKYESQAQEILSLLQVMCDSNKTSQATPENTTQSQGMADEILKLKELLDSGIITQEEFEAGKKKLLGI